MYETLTLGGTELEIHKTDDGFEVVEVTNDAIEHVEAFADDHEAIVKTEEMLSPSYDVRFMVENSHLPPGRGNIGTERTDAYDEHLAPEGISLNPVCIEPTMGGDAWNVYCEIET